MQKLPQEGEVIAGRYVVQRHIGQGGFASVFQGWDQEAKRAVALKIIMPEALQVKQVRRRLLREARLTVELTNPHTISVYDCGLLGDEEQGLPYIVMELLTGESLGTRLRRDGPLPPHEVARIFTDVLESLAEAHQKGIVHRDLKPDNVYLCEPPSPVLAKVLDFGIARAVNGEWGDDTMERLTRTGVIPGTVSYMAPEFFNGAPRVSPAADVYALGCMAHKLLTGNPPFQAATPTAVALKHIQELPPSLPRHVDEGLAEVIERSLLKDPEARYHDAAQMLATLRPVATRLNAPLQTPAASPSSKPSSPRPAKNFVPVQPSPPPEPDTAPNRRVHGDEVTKLIPRPPSPPRLSGTWPEAPQVIGDDILTKEVTLLETGPLEPLRRAPPAEIDPTGEVELTSAVELSGFEVPPPLKRRGGESLPEEPVHPMLEGSTLLVGAVFLGLGLLILLWIASSLGGAD
jgi:serine/threonine-protein kinase